MLFKKDNVVSYRIELLGNKYIVLTGEEEYIEPGYHAYKNDSEVTNEVIVKNEIQKNTPGIYRIIYQIDDYVEYRYIEIKEEDNYKLDIFDEVSNTLLTNEDVIINITVSGDGFISLTLPDKSVVKRTFAAYSVSENGVYVFEALNKNNETFTKEIIINNIDKSSPTGTCVATLNINNTLINVTSSESDLKYSYYENNILLKTLNTNNFTINNKTSDKIAVELEDEATNKTRINCSIIDKRYYEQVKPDATEKIVYHGDSETLKAYIVNRNTYYLTYIWVKDPYIQLNKFDSPEYGKNLYRPSVLMEKATTKNFLQNKIMIGFNASGFYLKDTFDAASVNAYSAYDKTSVGTLVITDGKVVRNAYNHAVKTWFIAGINPNNKLVIFEDKKADASEQSAKKTWSQTVISSGIRNTFTFAAPLIQNGVKTTITTSMPGGYDDYKGLQIICQINDNNFLLFTARSQTRNKAIEEFLKLGCKTATNLDGGGSIALLYKDKNSSEIKTAVGGDRALPEVAYFTE